VYLALQPWGQNVFMSMSRVTSTLAGTNCRAWLVTILQHVIGGPVSRALAGA